MRKCLEIIHIKVKQKTGFRKVFQTSSSKSNPTDSSNSLKLSVDKVSVEGLGDIAMKLSQEGHDSLQMALDTLTYAHRTKMVNNGSYNYTCHSYKGLLISTITTWVSKTLSSDVTGRRKKEALTHLSHSRDITDIMMPNLEVHSFCRSLPPPRGTCTVALSPLKTSAFTHTKV